MAEGIRMMIQALSEIAFQSNRDRYSKYYLIGTGYITQKNLLLLLWRCSMPIREVRTLQLGPQATELFQVAAACLKSRLDLPDPQRLP